MHSLLLFDLHLMLTTTKVLCPIFAIATGFLLLAVEDATLLQIVTLILGFLTTSLGTLMAYKMAQMNRAQIDAKSQVEHVITKVETIEKHTNSLAEKASKQAEEKGTLAGTLAEKERAEAKVIEHKLTEAKIEAEVQRRLQEVTQPMPVPASGAAGVVTRLSAIGTDVEEVKGDVKDVKTTVMQDVREGVKEGVKAATRSERDV